MESSLLTALYPIHPKLVHFPVALVISAMGMQGLGLLLKNDFLCKGARLMFVLAVIAIPVVIFSGLFEADRLHLHHPVLTAHKNFAFAAMWLTLISVPILWLISAKNNKFFQIIFFIVLFVASTLLGLAAHQGGRMVYEYGVGVNQ